MAEAPRFNVQRLLGSAASGYASQDAHALVAVCRLGTPVSFDRDKMASVSVTPSDGVKPREKVDPLLLQEDVVHLSVERSKGQHVKTATVVLRSRAKSALRTIHPGDWALVWLVPDRTRLDDLVARARTARPCNQPEDGLRLVGRVQQIRRRLDVAPDGKKTITYALQLVGFAEFDAQLYYDVAVATNDLMQQSVGRWMARIGVDAEAWFAKHAGSDRKDNINTILPEILKLVLGKGVSKDINAGSGEGLVAAAGAGAGEEAPNAYVVPSHVGDLLGRTPDASVLAYADLLVPFVGVEGYQAKEDDLNAMRPTVQGDLIGSFLPMFPQMINTPFWSMLQHYLNPAMNEMFTCLRVQGDGSVLPSWVVRQIPFTSDAFDETDIGKVTRFLELPRWVIPSGLVMSSDLGRSDSTRCNLVHVYGTANDFANNMSISKQLAEAPPIRDDLDIMRSGPRPLMMTVECAPDDQRGTAKKFMEFVADRAMGSHLTINGTVECLGLPGPIAEGDNVELDGLVFHVESIHDEYTCPSDGKKRWRTVLRLSFGLVAGGDSSLHYFSVADDGRGIEDSDPNVMDGTAPALGGR